MNSAEQIYFGIGTNKEQERTTIDGKNRAVREKKSRFASWSIYGTKSAAAFSAQETRNALPTVGVKVTLLDDGNTNKKRFNWDNAFLFQFTVRELPYLYALLLGGYSACEFGGHGQGTKSLSLMLSNNSRYPGYRLQATEKGRAKITVGITPEDAFYIAILVESQLRAVIPIDSISLLRDHVNRLVRINPNPYPLKFHKAPNVNQN